MLEFYGFLNYTNLVDLKQFTTHLQLAMQIQLTLDKPKTKVIDLTKETREEKWSEDARYRATFKKYKRFFEWAFDVGMLPEPMDVGIIYLIMGYMSEPWHGFATQRAIDFFDFICSMRLLDQLNLVGGNRLYKKFVRRCRYPINIQTCFWWGYQHGSNDNKIKLIDLKEAKKQSSVNSKNSSVSIMAVHYDIYKSLFDNYDGGKNMYHEWYFAGAYLGRKKRERMDDLKKLEMKKMNDKNNNSMSGAIRQPFTNYYRRGAPSGSHSRGYYGHRNGNGYGNAYSGGYRPSSGRNGIGHAMDNPYNNRRYRNRHDNPRKYDDRRRVANKGKRNRNKRR